MNRFTEAIKKYFGNFSSVVNTHREYRSALTDQVDEM